MHNQEGRRMDIHNGPLGVLLVVGLGMVLVGAFLGGVPQIEYYPEIGEKVILILVGALFSTIALWQMLFDDNRNSPEDVVGSFTKANLFYLFALLVISIMIGLLFAQ